MLALRDDSGADALVSMVRRREQAGRERKIARGRRDRGGRERRDHVPSEILGEHVFRVDAKSPGLVHLAPAMVGPSDSRVLVRSLQRADRGGRTAVGARYMWGKGLSAGRGRTRYVVLAPPLPFSTARQPARPHPSEAPLPPLS